MQIATTAVRADREVEALIADLLTGFTRAKKEKKPANGGLRVANVQDSRTFD
jgi:hypothetical protein